MTLPDITTVAIHSDDGRTIDRLTTTLGQVGTVGLVAEHDDQRLSLVDASMADAAATIRRLVDGGGACLAVCDGVDLDNVVDLLQAGAAGCIAARSDAGTLRHSMSAAARGSVSLPADVARRLAARAADDRPRRASGPPTMERAVLQQVIDERHFDIVAQPIADLRTGEIVAVESLARFTAEPARSPSVWLGAAQAAGLGVSLERELLRGAVALIGAVPAHIAVAANLSPAAVMAPGLADVLDGVSLDRLIIEITDHRRLDDYEPLSEALSPLRAAGLRIAVDDSGQGLSSLQQVAQLAPNYMKLNRTLTRNIDRDATRYALAYALTAFAAQVGSAVVAEGLETEAELRALRALGAQLGQGYLLAHPRAIAELELGVPVSLPASDGADAVPAPRLDVSAVVREDFHESARIALRRLSHSHPSSSFAVAHMDYVRRRHTIITSHGTLAAQLEPGRSMPLEDTMCFHMAAGRAPRLCPDVDADVLYGGLPLARELEAGSYAGVPLELPDGTRMGALFGVDRRPRAFAIDDLPLLDAIATVLGTVLVQQACGRDRGELLHYLRNLARTDSVTGVLNRPGFTEFLDDELDRPAARRRGAFVAVEVEDLASLRQHYGRTVADLAIKDLAVALRTSAEDLDLVGRLEENRFGVLLLCDPHEVAVPRLLQGLTSRLVDLTARREMAMSVRAGAVALSELTCRAEAWTRAADAMTRIT